MPVAFVKNKMSKEDMKLVEKDVGLAEDSWEFLKNAVADECHCLGSYVSTGDVKFLKELERARNVRTEVMDLISGKVIAQGWCRIKHLAGKAMTAQELCTRFLSVGEEEKAKKFADMQKDFYLSFLKILGFTKENLNYSTSA